MHKSNKYLFAILFLIGLFLFGAHYLRYQHNVILEKDGYQIIRIDKSQTISPHSEPIVFIIESGVNTKEIYKFNGYENNDFSSVDLDYFKTETADSINDYYFIEGFKNNFPVHQKLRNLDFEEMYDIVNSGKNFESRQLIQYNLESGILGYIDTMPLIFLVIGLFVFVILKIIDSIVFIFSLVSKNKKNKLVIQWLFIILLLFLLSNVRLVPWYPSDKVAIFVRNIIVIVPIFSSLRIIRNRYFKKDEFWKNQLISFLIIFMFGNILLLLGNKISFLIDKTHFLKISYKPFFCTYDSLAIGFLMSLAIGLILNNLFNEYFNKRKSTI